MITLFEKDIRTADRQSSKGNQLKWLSKGIWYKADYTGYEGLSEYMISNLLKKSSLGDKEYVLYQTENISICSRNSISSAIKLDPTALRYPGNMLYYIQY